MRILVISDTHGNVAQAFQAHTLAEPVDAVVHLGDGAEDARLLHSAMQLQVIAVAGNCDHNAAIPREMLWECEGKRILLAHGDAYGVKRGLGGLHKRALEVRADIVLFGHSHHATCITSSDILFLNPGTLTRTSTHKTFAILEISGDGVKACLHDLPAAGSN